MAGQALQVCKIDTPSRRVLSEILPPRFKISSINIRPLRDCFTPAEFHYIQPVRLARVVHNPQCADSQPINSLLRILGFMALLLLNIPRGVLELSSQGFLCDTR